MSCARPTHTKEDKQHVLQELEHDYDYTYYHRESG